MEVALNRLHPAGCRREVFWLFARHPRRRERGGRSQRPLPIRPAAGTLTRHLAGTGEGLGELGGVDAGEGAGGGADDEGHGEVAGADELGAAADAVEWEGADPGPDPAGAAGKGERGGLNM